MCDLNQLQTCTYPPGLTSQQMSQLMAQTFPVSGGVLVPGFNTDLADSRLDNQAFIWKYCSQNDSVNGGVCRDGLAQSCQIYSVNDTGNSYVRQLCGCYLSPDAYGDGGRDCSPSCIGQDSIKYFESENSMASRCTAGVCVIDQVTLQISGSSTGDLNFYQACPSCGPIPCRCIINDIDIITNDARIAGLNIQQNCPGGTVCYSTDENGNPVEVDCSTYLSSFSDAQQINSNRILYYTLLVVTIILFGLFLASIIAYFYEPPQVVIKEYSR